MGDQVPVLAQEAEACAMEGTMGYLHVVHLFLTGQNYVLSLISAEQRGRYQIDSKLGNLGKCLMTIADLACSEESLSTLNSMVPGSISLADAVLGFPEVAQQTQALES
jgi:hypothetical protein